MTPDDVLMIAVPLALLAVAAGAALFFRGRSRRTESAPRLTPTQLAAGAVAEGTRVQLVGVAAGELAAAPWSGAPCVAWAHTFTLCYKEEHANGVRDASERAEQREGGAWGLADGAASVEVRAFGGRARWFAGAPVAGARWEVSDRQGPVEWRVGAVPITAPSWRCAPGGYAFELRAEERVVAAGEALVVVGIARRDGGRWQVDLADDESGVTRTGAGELAVTDRRASWLFAGAGVAVVLAVVVGAAVALHREDGCVGVITPPVGRPTICCVPARGEDAAEVRVQTGDREAMVRVTGAPPTRLQVGDSAAVEGDTVRVPASATPVAVRVTAAAGGAPLPRFCVRVEGM